MYIDVCSVFFFRQKTAYEMRISDWSSDVCSSDLLRIGSGRRRYRIHTGPTPRWRRSRPSGSSSSPLLPGEPSRNRKAVPRRHRPPEIPCGGSVQPEFGSDVPEFARRDDTVVRHRYRMNPAFDVLLPEAEEPAQYRIARRQIETLPDEALQQVRMIRHVIQDLRGREPVMSELHREIAHRGLRRCRYHARILGRRVGPGKGNI